MSNPKYIEFNSSRRNRVLYPNPSDFIMNLEAQKTTEVTALDPVSIATPIFSWSSGHFQTGNLGYGYTPSISGTIEVPSTNLGNTTDNTLLILNTPYSNIGGNSVGFQQLKNYYINACIVVTNTNPAFPAPVSNTRRIASYEYLGLDGTNDRAMITLFIPFSDNLRIEQDAIFCEFTISDPSDYSNLNYPQIFVPAGLPQQNAYINYVLYNQSILDYRKILYYDEVTHLLSLDTINNKLSNAWYQNTNTFDNLYAQSYCIRKIEGDIINVQIDVSASTSTTLKILTFSNTNYSLYINQIIRITPFLYNYIISEQVTQTSKIVSIDLENPEGIFVTINPPISLPFVGNIAEILRFSYDNAYPFSYLGKDREPSDYRIELLNLILPNITLDCGYGGRIAFYPYVYVKIANASASSGGVTNLILSNNPNSNSAIFRCPINDINQPERSPFIKIDGNGMYQFFKFTPYDNLQFQVFLPNGEIYKTVTQDFYSPSEPNYEVQISALFSILKM